MGVSHTYLENPKPHDGYFNTIIALFIFSLHKGQSNNLPVWYTDYRFTYHNYCSRLDYVVSCE